VNLLLFQYLYWEVIKILPTMTVLCHFIILFKKDTVKFENHLLQIQNKKQNLLKFFTCLWELEGETPSSLRQHRYIFTCVTLPCGHKATLVLTKTTLDKYETIATSRRVNVWYQWRVPLIYLSGIRSYKSGFNYLTNYCVVRSDFLHIKKNLELKHITERRPLNTF
jgi:hypothetical protein